MATDKAAIVKEFINGEQIVGSENNQDISILVNFQRPLGVSVSVERATFSLDAYLKVLEHRRNIFEGLSYTYQVSNKTNTDNIEFWIDLTQDGVNNPARGNYNVKLVLKDGNVSLEDNLKAINYGYLESLGLITESDYIDVNYNVIEFDRAVKALTASIIIYILTTALFQRIKDLGKDNATSAGITASGVTGSIGATIFSVIAFILELAFSIQVAIQVASLTVTTLDLLLSPTRTHKAILFKTLLEKAAQHLGYTFETDLTDLDNIVYLPSNRNADTRGQFEIITKFGTIEKGIPNDLDYGYNCLEAYQLGIDYFNAVVQVVDGVIQFRSKNSDYWRRTADYTKPSVLIENEGDNSGTLASSRIRRFATDVTDEYTITEFTGTNYQVITDIKNPTIDDPSGKFINGLEEVNFPVALGNRKDSLTPLEQVLKTLASLADNVINTFGGNSKLAKKITSRIGNLKVSNNNHNVPKLLWLENGKIPSDHREKLSAKVSYEKYGSYESFVEENGGGQKLVYNEQDNPFGYEDFLKLIRNNYFYDEYGNECEAVNLEWFPRIDKCAITYTIADQYTDNLKETKLEG